MNKQEISEYNLPKHSVISLLIMLFCLTSCATRHDNQKIIVEIEKYQPNKTVITPRNKKIVLVGGCFDILHFGHIEFLRHARMEGDYLVVALEPDSRIRTKKRQPTHTQQQRAVLISPYVDKIILLGDLNGFADYNQLVKDVKPNVIAITADDPQVKNKIIQAKNVGATLKVVVERIGSFSSSDIYKKNR